MGFREYCRRRQAGVVVRYFPFIALLAATLVSPLPAQETGAGLDSATIVLLKPDRFVRLRVPELGRVQGHVGFRTSTEMVLQMERENRTISLGAIDTLWVRGRRTKTGAIIGALLGLGGGIALGAVVEALCEYDCDGNFVVGGAVFGAAAGGVTGAFIGAAIPRWRRVYPD